MNAITTTSPPALAAPPSSTLRNHIAAMINHARAGQAKAKGKSETDYWFCKGQESALSGLLFCMDRKKNFGAAYEDEWNIEVSHAPTAPNN